jgi:uncharacterized protein YbaR (Trm112 family)
MGPTFVGSCRDRQPDRLPTKTSGKVEKTEMIDKELLDILACPETKEPVHLAEQTLVDELNARIERGEVSNRGGDKVEKKMDGGLVREDRAFLYRIEDDIPIMLIDEAISLKDLGLQETDAGKQQ